MSREILHIPCGFRCFTKREMKNQLKISPQASLPFDSGFFTPSSIIKFMEDNVVEINLENTNPCIKTENFIKDGKKGIKFQETNYNLINKFIEDNGYENSYLDSTKGYYTLIKKYGFVLAHYNWHPSADSVKSKNITNPEENIKIVNKTFNRRKTRLLELIDNSSEINLYLYSQGNLFIQINNLNYNIKDDFLLLENYFKNRFPNKKIKTIYLDQYA